MVACCAGLQAEEKRLRLESKGLTYKQGPVGGRKKKPLVKSAVAASTPAVGAHAASDGAAASNGWPAA